MKDASNWASLLRMILYDVIGFFIPGCGLLAVLYVNLSHLGLVSKVAALPKLETYQIIAIVIASYILGHILQGLTYMHMLCFEWVGLGLLGSNALGSTEPPLELGSETNMAGRVAAYRFGADPFFSAAKTLIDSTLKLDASALKSYRTLEGVAFSAAGARAEVVLPFRFSADLEGAIATLSVIQLFFFVPAIWAGLPISQWWWLIPSSIGFWFLALGIVVLRAPHFSAVDINGTKTNKTWDTRRMFALLPFISVFLLSILVRVVSKNVPPFWWGVPMLVVVWLAMLYRAFFYYDLGGRLIIYLAVAEISRLREAGSSPRKGLPNENGPF